MNAFEIKLPEPRSFNNSICEFEGKLLMAYRAEIPEEGKISCIRICELDVEFNAVNIVEVNFPKPQPNTNLFEDPRLFVHKGELWLSFIAATYQHGPHYACQGVCKLDETLQPIAIFYPNAGKNHNDVCMGNRKLTREKNWTFFSKDGSIHVLYSINPLLVYIMDENTGEMSLVTESRCDDKWKYGEIHGGTGLVEHEGAYLGVFHSFTRENVRNYHVGFYTVDPLNWRVEKLSAEPWYSASYDDTYDKRPLTQSWRPNVVFPCGLMKKNGQLWISFGWQDCRAMLVNIPEAEAFNNLRTVKTHFEQKEVILDKQVCPNEGFKANIQGIEYKGRTWKTLKRLVSHIKISDSELEDAVTPHLSPSYKTKIWQPICK